MANNYDPNSVKSSRYSLTSIAIVIGATTALIGFIAIWLGLFQYMVVLMIASQPLIAALIWSRGRLLARLNAGYLQHAEQSNARLLGDIARMREEILDAIDETKQP